MDSRESTYIQQWPMAFEIIPLTINMNINTCLLMKPTKRYWMLIATLLLAISASAADQFVLFESSGIPLDTDGRVTIFLDSSCDKGVARAAHNLCTDIEKVCGARSTITDSRQSANIVISTDKSMKAREKFVIEVGQQMLITGSDKRGTIYGIYELSRQLGVSPWYYWADVPVEHHDHVWLRAGSYTDGEPAVRYRGIFLNDEAPCLTTWVKNTFGTDFGGHAFYEKVFELLLRLKGNFLWPAMWGWAFYADDPLNSPLADEMGIIIGTSHHEPMGRNHQEWARHRKEYGAWNYSTNKAVLDRFFREGIERIKNTEDVVTIGMRGDGDEAMSAEADTRLLLNIVANQRKIISDVTRRPARETPQVWALYKEVLDYYDKGMRVPDDVIMLLCDDNWGNVRRVPNAKERKHKGGWGLYYHVDYVGAPRNSKWLNVTPTQNMWEQLTLAYENGINQMWILNVGDLKPMEYPIQFFLDMAWKGSETLPDHTIDFCRTQFGASQAAEAARILNLCCKYNGRITAEMLDRRTYNLSTGEWQKVVADYTQLEVEALRQYVSLDPSYRDAYQQLVQFPIQAMGNIYQMYYAQAMNHQLYEAHNPDCNLWADKVEAAFRRDSLLCSAYNTDIAGGKWNGMMIQKHIGYRNWNDNFPRDIMPEVKRMATHDGGNVFSERDGIVAIEAEHYYSQTPAASASWTVIPFMGRTLSGITLRPYTQPVDGGELTYVFTSVSDVKKVHVVVKSTLDYLNQGGLCYEVSMDDGMPLIINFNQNLNEDPKNIYSIYYPTVARRVVESVVPLTSFPGRHTLTLRPLDPGIVFEKIVVDCGSYQPTYLYYDESPRQQETLE